MLSVYRPYAKQAEFHRAGADHRERLLDAGNRNGKTHAGGAESGYHLTGRYPRWWDGKRFAGPVRMYACGTSTEKVRDVVQRKLFGPPGKLGTGFIPKIDIADIIKSRGGGGLIDYATIKHQAGGLSWVSLKSYEQGWESFTADDLDVIWFDEEPDTKIYTEGQARTTDRRGIIYTTFTPLNGITEVVDWFWPQPNQPFRHLTVMTIDDAEHIPESRREEEIAKYPAHERAARAYGLPFLGSGKVYPVEEAAITEPPIEIPAHWPRIAGMDIGYDHPTAVAWLAWDRDADTIHVYDIYSQRGEQAIRGQTEPPVAIHASAIRAKGAWIPVAWPFDALRHEQGSSHHVADLYRKEGVQMLPQHATFVEGGYGTEAGVKDILGRMQTGRLKIASHLEPLWAEFRTYHRKEGRIVKRADDLLDAMRVAVMMLRFARVQKAFEPPLQVGMDYDPLEPQRELRIPGTRIDYSSAYDPFGWRH